MGVPQGTDINRIIGLGEKINPKTGRSEVITHTYPSYFRNVCMAFEETPIAKHFGLSIKEAMALPVDQWYQIRHQGEILGEKDKRNPDMETALFSLLKDMITKRGGDE